MALLLPSLEVSRSSSDTDCLFPSSYSRLSTAPSGQMLEQQRQPPSPYSTSLIIPLCRATQRHQNTRKAASCTEYGLTYPTCLNNFCAGGFRMQLERIQELVPRYIPNNCSSSDRFLPSFQYFHFQRGLCGAR
jgi:hypothetical protein